MLCGATSCVTEEMATTPRGLLNVSVDQPTWPHPITRPSSPFFPTQSFHPSSVRTCIITTTSPSPIYPSLTVSPLHSLYHPSTSAIHFAFIRSHLTQSRPSALLRVASASTRPSSARSQEVISTSGVRPQGAETYFQQIKSLTRLSSALCFPRPLVRRCRPRCRRSHPFARRSRQHPLPPHPRPLAIRCHTCTTRTTLVRPSVCPSSARPRPSVRRPSARAGTPPSPQSYPASHRESHFRSYLATK